MSKGHKCKVLSFLLVTSTLIFGKILHQHEDIGSDTLNMHRLHDHIANMNSHTWKNLHVRELCEGATVNTLNCHPLYRQCTLCKRQHNPCTIFHDCLDFFDNWFSYKVRKQLTAYQTPPPKKSNLPASNAWCVTSFIILASGYMLIWTLKSFCQN